MVPRLMVALLVILSGCAGISGNPSGQSPTEDPSSQVPTTTVHSPIRETESTSTTFTPIEATKSNTIKYAELTASEKRAFAEAVEHSARFFDGLPHDDSEYYDPDVARTFETHQWVVKNGVFYRISAYESLTPMFDVEATKAKPPENATTVALGNVSTPSRNYVRRAIENGTYTVPLGNPYPDDIDRGDYVRYGDETYEVSVGHGDLLVTVVQAEKWG